MYHGIAVILDTRLLTRGTKGGNIIKALEHIQESQFLNAQHDQRGLMASATLFESASFERLGQYAKVLAFHLGFMFIYFLVFVLTLNQGQSRLGYRICESVALLPASHVPLSDYVRAVCRLSHMLAQMGHYDSAKRILEEMEPRGIKGVVKLEERIAAFKALVDLKRLIHR